MTSGFLLKILLKIACYYEKCFTVVTINLCNSLVIISDLIFICNLNNIIIVISMLFQ